MSLAHSRYVIILKFVWGDRCFLPENCEYILRTLGLYLTLDGAVGKNNGKFKFKPQECLKGGIQNGFDIEHGTEMWYTVFSLQSARFDRRTVDGGKILRRAGKKREECSCHINHPKLSLPGISVFSWVLTGNIISVLFTYGFS